jgi:hypothetical protein
MPVETLERLQTIRFRSVREVPPARKNHAIEFEPNWGPEDMHAIKAIAYLMTGIFAVALVMYSTITLFAWLGIAR